MDNTFENGFMCGLLMSIDDKSYTKIKDPVFRDILENGVPVATINISTHYKNVLTWYHFTKFPCANRTRNGLSNRVAIDETIYYLNKYDKYFTDTHYEVYYDHDGPIVLFSVIYKGEEPLFATKMYEYASAYPVYRYNIVMHEDYSATDFSVGPHPYKKELVCWKQVDYKFLKENISYMGNYRLAAELKSYELTGGSTTSMYITAFISEEDDTTYSQLNISCSVERYNYTSSGPSSGIIYGRPIITLESTTVNDISYNLSPDYSYRLPYSYGTHSDFTIDDLCDIQFNIYDELCRELGKGVINPPKKAVLLN